MAESPAAGEHELTTFLTVEPAAPRWDATRMAESPAAGEHEQRVIVRWQLTPSICVAAGVVFAVMAVADSPFPWIVALLLSVFFWAGAVSGFRRRYEVRQDQLIIVRAFTRRTIVLSQLVSAEVVPMKASQGRVFWHLILNDQHNTSGRMSLRGTSRELRSAFLSAITPYVLAPDVHRSGRLADLLAGALW